MEVKPGLIEIIQTLHQEVDAFIANLSEAERAAVGEPDHWVAKDVIGHIATWQHRMIDTLEMAERGELPSAFGDFNHENALIFKLHRDQSWDMICTLLGTAYTRVIQYVQAASEEKLTDPEKSPRRNGLVMWYWILDISVEHPLEHLAAYALQQGQPDYGIQLYERFFPKISALIEAPRRQGALLYNFACRYAHLGQKTTAVAKLREALSIRPDLSDHAKQDKDLDSLRDDAGFKALFPS